MCVVLLMPRLGSKSHYGLLWICSGHRSGQSCHLTVSSLPLLLSADGKSVWEGAAANLELHVDVALIEVQGKVISGATARVLNAKQKAFQHTSPPCGRRNCKKPMSALHLMLPWQSTSNENSPQKVNEIEPRRGEMLRRVWQQWLIIMITISHIKRTSAHICSTFTGISCASCE